MDWQKNYYVRFLIFSLALAVDGNINAQYSNLHEFSLDSTMSAPDYNAFVTNGSILCGMTNLGGAITKVLYLILNKDGIAFQKLFDFDRNKHKENENENKNKNRSEA